MGQRTLAWPMAALLSALIVYASLYPFDGWRWSGQQPWAFLTASLPRYWTWFDVLSNWLGYVPLGFLCVLVALRSGASRLGWWLLLLYPSLLSLLLEAVQGYLSARVSSNVDWMLNSAGGAMGAGLAWGLSRTTAMQRWQRWRGHWFEADAHGALVLLALWPAALLYPTPLPFGVGQVGWMVYATAAQTLEGTGLAHWLPVVLEDPRPLSPLFQAVCMALLLLAPCLLGYSVLRGTARRALLLVVVVGGSVVVEGLSAALTYGPVHAWQWLTPPAVLALGLVAVLGVLGATLSRRACVVWLVWVLLTGLALLNSSPATPYFAESLQVWSQGRFIRFHGVTQWLGWLWPYAAMVHAAAHISGRRALRLDTRLQD